MQGVIRKLITGRENIVLRAERQQRLGTARTGIDQIANLARIGPARPVGVDEVLLNVRANELRKVTQMPHNGIVAQHVVPGMGCIEQAQHDKRADHGERPQGVLPKQREERDPNQG